jgi:hypothetical protein
MMSQRCLGQVSGYVTRHASAFELMGGGGLRLTQWRYPSDAERPSIKWVLLGAVKPYGNVGQD